MRHLRSVAAAALLAAAPLAAPLATPAAAQGRGEKLPPRPPLPALADTNDQWAYYNEGLRHLKANPSRAADLFYWASRLAPTWGEPLYARRAALHLADKPRLWRYLTGQRGTVRSRPVRAIDSLATEAMLRNPFFSPRFDRLLMDEAIAYVSNGTAWLDRARSGNPGWDAQMAFADGRLADAVRLYADAIRRRPRDYGYRAPRGRAFVMLLQYDSAANEFTQLLAEMRKKDEKELVYFYDSKAIFEYSLGRTYYQMERYDEARAAYGRALEEDLSFHVAHRDLAEIAFLQGDTATGIAELALAAQLRPGDAGTRMLYGDALVRARRHDEAKPEYEAAIAAEPWFALPYFQLARLHDAQGSRDDAVAQYRAFLARAARDREEVVEAKRRLGALGAPAGDDAAEPRS